jgi:hypothetical protein
MGGTIIVICVNVSQKYIYASVRGGLGPIRGVFFVEQGVGVGWKKGVLKGVTLHMIWGIFRKIYIRGSNGAFSHVFLENEELFVHVQGYGAARVPSRVSGGWGAGPPAFRAFRSETIQNPPILADWKHADDG